MHSMVPELCRNIYMSTTKACWTWYASHIENVRTPKQLFRESIKLADSWAGGGHLQQMIEDTMYKRECIDYLTGPNASQQEKVHICSRALLLTWRILANRSWSLACQHRVPPETCAGLAFGSRDIQQRAALSMQRKLNRRVAQELWKDIDFLSNAPLRLMFMFVEHEHDHVLNGELTLALFVQSFTIIVSSIVMSTIVVSILLFGTTRRRVIRPNHLV